MGKTSRPKADKLLTEVELEMMNILWRRGGGSVNDVLEGLSGGRKLAYTSVSTMLRILEQKGVLRSEKAGRGHIYHPKLEKQDYEKRSVEHLVHNVFDGTASQLVRRLLEVDSLTEEDLQGIRKLLDKRQP